MSEPVTLMNVFDVNVQDLAACIEYWDQANAFMCKQPGFISTKLHQATSPEAKFQLINVALWESAEHFMQAVSNPQFQAIVQPMQQQFPHYPSLYEVIRQ